MSAFLAYSYSTGLTKEEQTEIDKKTKYSREEFSKGFKDFMNIPKPGPKPGFKRLSEGAKGTYGAGAVCASVLNMYLLKIFI